MRTFCYFDCLLDADSTLHAFSFESEEVISCCLLRWGNICRYACNIHMESKKTSLVQTFEALNVRQAGFLSIYLYLSIAAWLQYINAVPQGRALTH